MKLPNKIHIKCEFKCIFNICSICKVNSDTFFAFLFFLVAHLGVGPRRMKSYHPCQRRRKIGSRYPHEPRTACKQICGRFRSQTFKNFKVIEIHSSPPWCRSTIAGLPDGVGDFLPLREIAGFPWVPFYCLSPEGSNIFIMRFIRSVAWETNPQQYSRNSCRSTGVWLWCTSAHS